ncbi:MAG: amidohydrolase family protein [Lachnospiraceae bacterium]|nr:amidohydrolase family protein [Lachnospiraceae bacterium]
MIIDFHTHVFPEKIAERTLGILAEKSKIAPETDGTVHGLLSSMEEAGVDTSVILPVVTAPKQFASIMRFGLEINEAYGYLEKSWEKKKMPKLISFGGIHPDSADYKGELKALAEAGFPGIKIHPDYQGVFFHDIRYLRIISYAQELGLVVVTHAGVDTGLPEPVHCTPGMAVEVLKETEVKKLVLAHLGGWCCWDELERIYDRGILRKGQIYLDTAFIQRFIQPSQFSSIVQKAGRDHVLFATDSPWSGQKEGVCWLKDQVLPEEDANRIGFWNAAELLGIR